MSEPTLVGGSIQAPPIFRVPKRCPKCGAEWEGNSFSAAPKDGSRVAYPCDSCIDAEMERRKLLSAKIVQDEMLLEPSKPRRAGADE